jgi:hypothetical protein
MSQRACAGELCWVAAMLDWITRGTAEPARIPSHGIRLQLLRETMSSSKPAFSVEVLGMRAPSSSMRAARSFRAISSGSPAYGYEGTTPSEMRVINQKLRKAIENEGRVARIEGLWWHVLS